MLEIFYNILAKIGKENPTGLENYIGNRARREEEANMLTRIWAQLLGCYLQQKEGQRWCQEKDVKFSFKYVYLKYNKTIKNKGSKAIGNIEV
jgi:hypothetical protein